MVLDEVGICVSAVKAEQSRVWTYFMCLVIYGLSTRWANDSNALIFFFIVVGEIIRCFSLFSWNLGYIFRKVKNGRRVLLGGRIQFGPKMVD